MGQRNRLHHGDLLRRVLLLPLLLASLPAHAEDLMTTYRMALRQAPQLRIAESAALAAEAGRKEARALLLPSIDLSAGYASDTTDNTIPAGSSYSGTPGLSSYPVTSYSLSLTQPLYNGQASAYYRAARDVQNQQQQLYGAARQLLMVQVTQAYFAVLEAQHNLSLSEAEKTALLQRLNEMRQRLKVGLATRTELHETQASYDLSVADVLTAELELDTRRELLAELIGQAPGRLQPLASNLALTPPDPDAIDVWEKRALDNHPEYKASRQATEAATETLKAEQRAYLPTLSLAYDYSHADTDSGGSTAHITDSTSLGVQFSLPIFSGGSTSARIARARAELQMAKAEQEQVRRKISRQVRQAFIKLKSDINRVKALSRALLSTQQALDATRVGLKVGARSNLDLLNARRELLRAKRNYAQARYDYLVTGLELYRATGELDESRLQAVNRWLQ